MQSNVMITGSDRRERGEKCVLQKKEKCVWKRGKGQETQSSPPRKDGYSPQSHHKVPGLTGAYVCFASPQILDIKDAVEPLKLNFTVEQEDNKPTDSKKVHCAMVIRYTDERCVLTMVDSNAAQDALKYKDVHWQLLHAGQVYKLHMTHVCVQEGWQGIIATGTYDTKAFRVIAGFTGRQLMGIVSTCKHLNHGVRKDNSMSP
ncbi:hypothetical protein CB1_000276003 [Camelus ferus]|nr:hypothetical protein CB1_000276003 [Camelus ferus]